MSESSPPGGGEGGAYLRRIRLSGRPTGGGGEVAAELEDDFHHFVLELHHDGAKVTAVTGRAVRYPWSACVRAPSVLAGIAGAPLSTRSTAHAAHLAPRANCTHLFDLAGLALAHATRGLRRRQYDVRVPDRVNGETEATLHCDGALSLRWRVSGRTIVGPAPYAGRRLRGSGFITWAEDTLDPDEAEAALILRRALDIGMGRGMDLDSIPNAGTIAEMVGPACFTFQPERAASAARMTGTSWDFSGRPDLLLGGATIDPAVDGGASAT